MFTRRTAVRLLIACTGLAVGCDPPPPPPNAPPPAVPIPPPLPGVSSEHEAPGANRPAGASVPPLVGAFDDFVAQAVNELQAKNESNRAWGLGSFARWNLDQTTGRLEFTAADGGRAVTPAQIIGSYQPSDRSWRWAWDNPSIKPALQRDSLLVKRFGEQHGIARLTSPRFVGEEADAWAMTAIAFKLTGAQGAYRAPAGSTIVFLTFGEVRAEPPAAR